jgi:hypothetical protein
MGGDPGVPASAADTASLQGALVEVPDPQLSPDGGSNAGPSPSTATVTSFLVGGGSPQTMYTDGSDEGSIDVSTSSDATAWAASFNSSTFISGYNWGDPETTPNPTANGIPTVSGYADNTDTWVTHSQYTQLNYYSTLMTHNGAQCLGLGATTWANLNTNTWDYPAECFSTEFVDGTNIHYDDGFHNLWAATGSNNKLYLFKNCTGRPGMGTCALSGAAKLDQTPPGGLPPGYVYIVSHPEVDSSPCTYNGLVAYRASTISGGTGTHAIVLETWDKTTLTRINQHIVDSFAFNTNDNCQVGYPINRCGAGSSTNCTKAGIPNCMRSNLMVHVTTKASGSTCYAYIGYDTSCPFAGKQLFKGTMAIVDITNDGFSVVKKWKSSDCSGANATADNEFHTTLAASQYNNDVGFFYYQLPADPQCRKQRLQPLHHDGLGQDRHGAGPDQHDTHP